MRSVDEVFEGVIWSSRFAVLVAVLASLVAALGVFFVATIDVLSLLGHVAHYASAGLAAEARSALHDRIVTHVVEVVDGYLLGAVLLIFAFGLYELFVRKISRARVAAGGSKLLVIETFDDLKSRLAQVILLILIVNLFQDALEVHLVSALDLVCQGAAIALVGLALFLSYRSAPHPPSA